MKIREARFSASNLDATEFCKGFCLRIHASHSRKIKHVQLAALQDIVTEETKVVDKKNCENVFNKIKVLATTILCGYVFRQPR